MTKSSLTPTGYRLLIKPDPLEEKSAGGIVIVHENEQFAKAAIQSGVVVKIGPTAWNRHEGGYEWCKVGDHVLYSKYAGKLIKDPETEEEFLVVNDEDILTTKDGEE